MKLWGMVVALTASVLFGTSGTLASALLAAGWSAGAAVTLRISIAAVLLTLPALIQLRGRWQLLRREAPQIVLFGLLAVVGAQFFYFQALTRVTVGVALLLEYLGVLLVVGWMWLRHGRRPQPLTIGGAAVAIGGLALVLDLTGATVDPIGVLWGLGAAVGLAAFYVLSAKSDGALPPLVLAWAGMVVGSLALIALSVTGLLPYAAPRVDVQLAGTSLPWWVPMLGLAVLAGALGYCAAIVAARLLGATVASFVGLTEVLAAVAIAWLVLGQAMTTIQLIGGVLIVGGVVLVRWDELRRAAHIEALDPEPLPPPEAVNSAV